MRKRLSSVKRGPTKAVRLRQQKFRTKKAAPTKKAPVLSSSKMNHLRNLPPNLPARLESTRYVAFMWSLLLFHQGKKPAVQLAKKPPAPAVKKDSPTSCGNAASKPSKGGAAPAPRWSGHLQVQAYP
jgi:hypothetical protein